VHSSMSCWCSSMGLGAERRSSVLDEEGTGKLNRAEVLHCTSWVFALHRRQDTGQLTGTTRNKQRNKPRPTCIASEV
jgi:hypothetical protein